MCYEVAAEEVAGLAAGLGSSVVNRATVDLILM